MLWNNVNNKLILIAKTISFNYQINVYNNIMAIAVA